MKNIGKIVSFMNDRGYSEFSGAVGPTGVVAISFKSLKKSGLEKRKGIREIVVFFFKQPGSSKKNISSQIKYYNDKIVTIEVDTLNKMAAYLENMIEMEGK